APSLVPQWWNIRFGYPSMVPFFRHEESTRDAPKRKAIAAQYTKTTFLKTKPDLQHDLGTALAKIVEVALLEGAERRCREGAGLRGKGYRRHWTIFNRKRGLLFSSRHLPEHNYAGNFLTISLAAWHGQGLAIR